MQPPSMPRRQSSFVDDNPSSSAGDMQTQSCYGDPTYFKFRDLDSSMSIDDLEPAIEAAAHVPPPVETRLNGNGALMSSFLIGLVASWDAGVTLQVDNAKPSFDVAGTSNCVANDDKASRERSRWDSSPLPRARENQTPGNVRWGRMGRRRSASTGSSRSSGRKLRRPLMAAKKNHCFRRCKSSNDEQQRLHRDRPAMLPRRCASNEGMLPPTCPIRRTVSPGKSFSSNNQEQLEEQQQQEERHRHDKPMRRPVRIESNRHLLKLSSSLPDLGASQCCDHDHDDEESRSSYSESVSEDDCYRPLIKFPNKSFLNHDDNAYNNSMSISTISCSVVSMGASSTQGSLAWSMDISNQTNESTNTTIDGTIAMEGRDWCLSHRRLMVKSGGKRPVAYPRRNPCFSQDPRPDEQEDITLEDTPPCKEAEAKSDSSECRGHGVNDSLELSELVVMSPTKLSRAASDQNLFRSTLIPGSQGRVPPRRSLSDSTTASPNTMALKSRLVSDLLPEMMEAVI